MGRPLSVFWLCLLAVSVICACWPLSWGRYLSIFRPCLLAVPVGHVCCLCLLSALVAAAPFYRLAVPVGCACWPCLLSVPLVRARGGGTFLSFGRACCLCLLAMSVVCVCCPRSWGRYPGFHQRGDPSGGTSRRRAGRSSFGCRKRDDRPTTLQRTARADPPVLPFLT